MKNSFDVFGSCVSRDIFGIGDIKKQYDVKGFIQGINPIATFIGPKSSEFDLEAEMKDPVFDGCNNFYRRLIVLDYYNAHGSFLFSKERKANYLLIDTFNFRHNRLLKIGENILTLTGEEKVYDQYLFKYVQKKTNMSRKELEGKIIDTDNLPDEEFDTLVKYFCLLMKEQFPIEKIFILDAQACFFSVSKDNKTGQFKWVKDSHMINIRARRGMRFLMKYLDKAHVINDIGFMIGSDNHKWGPCPLHFDKSFYDFTFKYIDSIVGNKQKDKEALEEMVDDYNLSQKLRLEKMLNPVLAGNKNLQKENYRHNVYEEYCRNFILGNKEKELIDYLKNRNLESVSIYGISQLTRFIGPLLKRNGITINCIYENFSSAEFKDIPIVRRDAIAVRDKECILICDLRTSVIRKKFEIYSRNVTVVDAFEIVNIDKNYEESKCF